MTTAIANPPQTPPPKNGVPAKIPDLSAVRSSAPLRISPEGPPLYSLTVDQYERMTAAGILTTKDRCELLNGQLVMKMPPNPPHATALALLRIAFKPLVPADWFERVQDPIALDVSEPEPDLTLVQGDPRAFVARHPRPADIGLVVEVADSSLAYDRAEKLIAYAANGIVEYWIVNLVDRRVEVYASPAGPSYANQRSYTPAESVPLVIDGKSLGSIPVVDLLP